MKRRSNSLLRIVVLLAGLAATFAAAGCSGGGGQVGGEPPFQTGALILSPDLYNSIPLASVPAMGVLPAQYDLSSSMPPIGDQGHQGSCVGWATGYYMKGYQEQVERRWGNGTPEHQFSPAYVFNQITQSAQCAGSQIFEALNLLSSQGVSTFARMPYADTGCQEMPGDAARAEAPNYRIKTWRRVNFLDPTEVKSHVAAGFPVVIGTMVDRKFMELPGSAVYRDPTGSWEGGHAMNVVGYDDAKGAYRLINSWSARWADSGYGWVDYQAFQVMMREAYVSEDMQQQQGNPPASPTGLAASDGTFADFVRLSWNSVANADGYKLYQATASGGPFTLIQSGEATSHDDPTALADPTNLYYYQVSAFNSLGESARSAVESGYRSGAPNPTLAAPANVSASDGTDPAAIVVTWNAVTGAEGYKVYKAAAAGGEFSLVTSTTETSYRDPVSDTEQHCYAVKAYDPSAESPLSGTDCGSKGTQTEKSVNFEDLWVDHNTVGTDVQGRSTFGMLIHAKFTIQGYAGEGSVLGHWFYTSSGVPLPDMDGQYRTDDGKIAVGVEFQPANDNASYQDLSVFMPYDQLDQTTGTHSLMFITAIYVKTSGEFIGEVTNDPDQFFTLTVGGQAVRLAVFAGKRTSPFYRNAPLVVEPKFLFRGAAVAGGLQPRR